MEDGLGKETKMQSVMEGLIMSFSDQLDRMAKNTDRIRILGNKLHEEETIVNKTSEGQPPRPNGLMPNLERYKEILINLNCAQESQLQKLENLL